MEANRSFSDYTLDNYNFGISDIYTFPKVINTVPLFQYNAPVIEDISFETISEPVFISNPTPIAPIEITPIAPIAPVSKTIAFTVATANETLPGANIAIDGVGKAQTNSNGYVVIPNVLPTSMVKISYVGYEDYVVQASELPAKILLKTTTYQLNEVEIPNNYKKPTSNAWMWWLVGAVGAFGIYKYSKTGVKVVKAKI
jgi:hypothetical protein